MLQTDGAFWEVRGVLDDGTTMCALIPQGVLPSPAPEPGSTALFTFSPMSVILIAE